MCWGWFHKVMTGISLFWLQPIISQNGWKLMLFSSQPGGYYCSWSTCEGVCGSIWCSSNVSFWSREELWKCHVFWDVWPAWHSKNNPLHPQLDGIWFSFNLTLEAQLSKFAEDHQLTGIATFPYCWWHIELLSMRVQGALLPVWCWDEIWGCPYLLYGRPDQEPSRSTPVYSENLEARLEQVQEFARDHLKIVSDWMKERYDSLVDAALLERGGPVWLYNPQRKKGKSLKLTRPWQGPYLMIKRINDVEYRVQLCPRSKPKVVHVHGDRLWRYSGTSTPDWLDRTHTTPRRTTC